MRDIPITPAPVPTIGEKLLIAVDLMGFGFDLMRENLRRVHPDATDTDIDRLLVAWAQSSPSPGAAAGVPSMARRGFGPA